MGAEHDHDSCQKEKLNVQKLTPQGLEPKPSKQLQMLSKEKGLRYGSYGPGMGVAQNLGRAHGSPCWSTVYRLGFTQDCIFNSKMLSTPGSRGICTALAMNL